MSEIQYEAEGFPECRQALDHAKDCACVIRSEEMESETGRLTARVAELEARLDASPKSYSAGIKDYQMLVAFKSQAIDTLTLRVSELENRLSVCQKADDKIIRLERHLDAERAHADKLAEVMGENPEMVGTQSGVTVGRDRHNIGDLFDDIASYLGVSSYELEQALMQLASARLKAKTEAQSLRES